VVVNVCGRRVNETNREGLALWASYSSNASESESARSLRSLWPVMLTLLVANPISRQSCYMKDGGAVARDQRKSLLLCVDDPLREMRAVRAPGSSQLRFIKLHASGSLRCGMAGLANNRWHGLATVSQRADSGLGRVVLFLLLPLRVRDAVLADCRNWRSAFPAFTHWGNPQHAVKTLSESAYFRRTLMETVPCEAGKESDSCWRRSIR